MGTSKYFELLGNVLIDLYTKLNIKILIGGDININPKRRKKRKKLYSDFVKQHCLTQLIMSNTHFNLNTATTSAIDHFMTNNADLYNQHVIFPMHLSDHYLNHCSHKKIREKIEKINIFARNYKYDPVKLESELEKIDWPPLFVMQDVYVAWNIVCTFSALLDVHAPWEERLVPITTPEWITHEFISEF